MKLNKGQNIEPQLACEQAIQGALVARREKERELAT